MPAGFERKLMIMREALFGKCYSTFFSKNYHSEWPDDLGRSKIHSRIRLETLKVFLKGTPVTSSLCFGWLSRLREVSGFLSLFTIKKISWERPLGAVPKAPRFSKNFWKISTLGRFTQDLLMVLTAKNLIFRGQKSPKITLAAKKCDFPKFEISIS